jgi:hypothetical protein
VRGFDLGNVPKVDCVGRPALPFVVPLLYNGSRRRVRLAADAVAVPLGLLFDRRSGALKFRSREEVARAFQFDPAARLVLSGVDHDQPIEDYWAHRRAARLVEQLAALRPDLVTSPNYSLLLDVPRHDNLHNIKRIAICWAELAGAGVPAALHLNARTDHDWRRWTDFVAAREEVTSVAFEYATGAARMDRGTWHTHKLVELAAAAGRGLQIVVRGGQAHLGELERAFSEVVFIDTTSFVKTVKRQRLDWGPGAKRRWRSALTPRGYPLDELLQHNVETFAAMITFDSARRCAARV